MVIKISYVHEVIILQSPLWRSFWVTHEERIHDLPQIRKTLVSGGYLFRVFNINIYKKDKRPIARRLRK